MSRTESPWADEIRHGLLGGLIGGIVFAGIMVVNGTLTDMGMLTLPLIGSLVGNPSPWVGLAVHLLNSAIIGIGYVFTLGRLEKGMVDGLHLGMIYGAIWWVIGPLTLMPLLLGEPIGNHWSFAAALTTLPSLVGHVVFGVILGMTVGAFRDYSLPEEPEAEPAIETIEQDPGLGRADFVESPPPSARPKSAGAPRLVPIWMSMGLLLVVLVMNLVIFGYAALSGGFPHAQEKHAVSVESSADKEAPATDPGAGEETAVEEPAGTNESGGADEPADANESGGADEPTGADEPAGATEAGE